MELSHQSSVQSKMLGASAQRNVELQKCLQQSATADHSETRDGILVLWKSQETSFKNLDEKVTQVRASVQHNSGQVELLLALQRSIAVSILPFT